MRLLKQVSELAREAGDERNRYADFLRAVSIVLVVVGHWIVIDLELDSDIPEGINALAQSSWIHWGTWAFQVIPLFFLVGGYANAVSWRHHRDEGYTWASWLRRRTLRLLWPTAIFVTAGLVFTPLASLWDVPVAILSEAAWAIAIILWFLAVYLAIAVVTPLSFRAHERWGIGFVLLLIALVAGVDAIRFLGEVDLVAYVNYALVWGAFHQVGYLWADGELPSLPSLAVGVVISLTAAFALVNWGPYPVSMVSVPGAEVQNTAPPTLALLMVGVAQIGFVLALRQLVRPRLEGDSNLWRATVAGNVAIMTVFLWHVVPVLVLAWILSTLGVSLPSPPGSFSWLAFQPIWILMLAVLLIPIVLVVRHGERPPEKLEKLASRETTGWSPLALGLGGVAIACVGLARLTLAGFWVGEPTVIPVWGALAFFVGGIIVLGTGSLGKAPR